jgi:SagB-type dehydrogenase family enzyme
MGQTYVTQAAGVLMLTAVVQRTMRKYGDRGYRYILLEAGHVAQNVNLAATALGIGTVDLGGFFDDEMGSLLGSDRRVEVALYGVAFGNPSSGDRAILRMEGARPER